MKFYIGIDNGVTGTIGVVERDDGFIYFSKTPVKKQQDYTKAKKGITRVNVEVLFDTLKTFVDSGEPCFALLERPMTDPKKLTAMISALRALEATLTVLETLKIPYSFIDSKEWQGALLPKGTKGHDALKAASKSIGDRLFPSIIEFKHPDRDGILIAEYARRKNY